MNADTVRAILYLRFFCCTTGFQAITTGRVRILSEGVYLLDVVFIKSEQYYGGGVLSYGPNFNDKEIRGILVSEEALSLQEAANLMD